MDAHYQKNSLELFEISGCETERGSASWTTDLAEDILQPELKPTEDETVAFDSGQTELAKVEAGEVERAATDEQVVRLGDVDVATTVDTAQRHAVELHVTHVHAVR